VGSAELEVIRDQYAAVNERDWERAMSHYAEDVVLVVPPDQGVRAGTFSGREAVGRWFGDWFSSFDRDLHFEIMEISEDEDGSVFLDAVNRARGRTSGIELAGRVRWRFELRGDKIVRVEQLGWDERGSATAGEDPR